MRRFLLGSVFVFLAGCQAMQQKAELPLVEALGQVGVEATGSVALAADGRRLALSAGEGKLVLINIPGMEMEQFETAFASKTLDSISWSDGESLVLAGRDGSIRLLRPGDEEPEQSAQVPDGLRSFAFDSANMRVLAGDAKGFLASYSWPRLVWREDRQFGKSIDTIAVAGNGNFLALVLNGSDVALLDAEFKRLLPFDPAGAAVDRLVFSPTGRWLAGAVGSRLLLWDLLTGEKEANGVVFPGDIRDIAWSADETRLYLAGGSSFGGSALQAVRWRDGAVISAYDAPAGVQRVLVLEGSGQLIAVGKDSVAVFPIEAESPAPLE